jgi:lysyl endopeptidase
MKKLTFLALCLPFASVWAQVTNQVNPKSWSQSQVNHPQIVEMPVVNLDALRAEDELQKTQNIQKPYRFGYGFETSLGFENGIWTELPNGDRLWQIEIHSQDAISMNFILENLHLPKKF